jgi:trehalose 6-phosphate phosphatase
VITGRPSREVERLVRVDGVRVVGLYGLEEAPGEGRVVPGELVRRAEDVARRFPGAWVEHKGGTIAVHVRGAADPPAAEAAIEAAMTEAAAAARMRVLRGKRVLELVPDGAPLKDAAVRRLVGQTEVEAALYAGDDLPDLRAFEALDELAGDGLFAVKVAVRGSETPDELLAAADLAVDGPAGVVRLLEDLAKTSAG